MIEVQNSSNSETTIKNIRLPIKSGLKRLYIRNINGSRLFCRFLYSFNCFLLQKDFYRILSSYILIVILILVIYRIVKPISNYYKTIKTLKTNIVLLKK